MNTLLINSNKKVILFILKSNKMDFTYAGCTGPDDWSDDHQTYGTEAGN